MCDVDGFTSAAIMYNYIQRMNCHCQVDYWLHSGKAHGLQDHIDRLLDEGVNYDLLILPDSSSNDAEYHTMLESIHLPCLVIDHHLTDVALSDNAVVINNQLSPNYENKQLTGSGMAYQFCRYIDSLSGQRWADDFIDLAAWGIIADMGNLLSMENRYIIDKGLRNIKNKFLLAILEKQGYSITGQAGATLREVLSKVTPISMAFYIAPLVNAVIRVGTQQEKEYMFQAFIDGDTMIPCKKRGAPKDAMEKASIEVTRLAANARSRQNKLIDEAMNAAEIKISKYGLLDDKVMILQLDETDKLPSEINGLLAMKLVSKYQRPAMVLRAGPDGCSKGSMRCMNNGVFDSFKDFIMSSGCAEWCQGHAFAAGVALHTKQIQDFLNWTNEQLKDTDLTISVYHVNFSRQASDRDIYDIVNDITSHNSLYGQGFSEPLIHVSSIPCNPSALKIMGADKDSVKIEVNGVAYVKFKDKEFIEKLEKGECTLEIVGRANMNEWCGRRTAQIFIDDYEIHKANSICDF